ncbi:MAG: UPF0182 family protein [Desulfobacterales bacterium]
MFLLSLITVDFLVNWWWFGSVGYDFYFLQRLLYKYAVFAVSFVVFFLIFYLNFRFASRYLRNPQPSPTDRMRERLRKLRLESRLVYIPLSVILAIVIAIPLFQHWSEFLFYIFGAHAGVKGPVFGIDISYYLFSLPIYILIQQRLLIAFLILLVGLGIFYWVEYRYAPKAQNSMPHQIGWHLGVLGALVVLIKIWGTSLWLHSLVYTTVHEPLFYGPGYIEKRVLIPLTWAQMALLAATAVCVGLAFKKHKSFLIAAGILAACYFTVLGLRHATSFKQQFEEYVIKPNQLQMERPFIAMNIKGTLDAYGLSAVEKREFTRQTGPHENVTPEMQKVLANAPLWNKTQLEKVYRQLEELRTYYDFPLVNSGRYTVNGQYSQVFLAARELNPDRLPAAAKTWVNHHLIYTHSFGLVMTPANQNGEEPMVWFLRGLPLESDYGMAVKRAEVYFGTGAFNNFVIAPNENGEVDYPQGDTNVTSHYSGRGGVALTSFFRRIIFAYYLKDKNILISTQFVERSRIMFVRNIVDRVRKLTPYLLLDGRPYLAMTPEGLYWIQDAYTTSDKAPDSQPITYKGQHFNYIRNSVKIVVSAYDGSVDFYIADPQDPIVRTYSRIYPGLFKKMSEMPDDIRVHIRYPQDLFEVQMRVYAKYHQTDPQTFYENEDVWQFARTLRGPGATVLNSHYLSLNLIDRETVEFLLLQPMSPKNQDNLRALVLVGCDRKNYGRIIVYDFPKGQLVYSPVQMDALINADPEIVRQFSLWNITGSEIARGEMIVLPADREVYYIQPIFLMSRSLGERQIPRLQRVVMTEGQVAVMDASIENAYLGLNKRLKKIEQEIFQHFGPPKKAGPKPPGS